MTGKCPCKFHHTCDTAWLVVVSFGVGILISVGFFAILGAVFG